MMKMSRRQFLLLDGKEKKPEEGVSVNAHTTFFPVPNKLYFTWKIQKKLEVESSFLVLRFTSLSYLNFRKIPFDA